MEWLNSTTIPDKEVEGLSYHVYVAQDYDAKPTDFDCYTPKQREAWGKGEWMFVWAKVVPAVDGDELDMCADTLGAIEYGELPITDEDDNVTQTLSIDINTLNQTSDNFEGQLPEMIANVQNMLIEQIGPKVDKLREVLKQLEIKNKLENPTTEA